jgi:hypothetical protein
LLRYLAQGAATSDEAAADLGFEPLACRKVMAALSALGLLRRDADGFRVVDDLVPLFAEGEGDIAPFLEHLRNMSMSWGEHLQGWLETGEWPSTPRTREQVAVFGSAMRAIGSHTARLVAGAMDLRGVERLLDLGGGLGHMARALCDAAGPTCVATVVDHPEVATAGAASVLGTPWEDRLHFVGGDYADETAGGGYDLVLLANVLHQEQPPRTAAMLANAAAAAAAGGRVAVLDFAIDEGRCGHRMGTLFAVNMKAFGDTWTESEIRGWMLDAGLEAIARIDLGPDRWLIQGRRPG